MSNQLLIKLVRKIMTSELSSICIFRFIRILLTTFTNDRAYSKFEKASESDFRRGP